MATIGHSSHVAALRYQHATVERSRAIAEYLDGVIDAAATASRRTYPQHPRVTTANSDMAWMWHAPRKQPAVFPQKKCVLHGPHWAVRDPRVVDSRPASGDGQ